MVFSAKLIIVFALMFKGRRKQYLPAVVWAILIMIVSSIPDISTPGIRFTFADKIAHFIEYFILGLLTANAVRAFARKSWSIFWISALLAAIYGVLDEFHQLLVPGRSMEGWDMAADFLGAILASAIFVRFLQIKARASSRD
ncbi:MAG: VanZ family protein [candidate division Zixibacteria bacterium]